MMTYHTQPHSFVAIHKVAEILARSCDRDPLFVSQLVESALNAKVRFPKLTIS
jgi:hypothetical protein